MQISGIFLSLVTRQMAREIIGRAPSRGLLDPPPSNCSGPDLMPPMPLIEISEIDVLALDEKGDLSRPIIPRRRPAPQPSRSDAVAATTTGSSTLDASASADLREEIPPSASSIRAFPCVHFHPLVYPAPHEPPVMDSGTHCAYQRC